MGDPVQIAEIFATEMPPWQHAKKRIRSLVDDALLLVCRENDDLGGDMLWHLVRRRGDVADDDQTPVWAEVGGLDDRIGKIEDGGDDRPSGAREVAVIQQN